MTTDLSEEALEDVSDKQKARQLLEYMIGGWFSFADVQFNFEALPLGEIPLYDGPGYALDIVNGKYRWQKGGTRGADQKKLIGVPMHPDKLMLCRGGMLFRALMDLPCALDEVARVVMPFREGVTGLVLVTKKDTAGTENG